MRLRSLLTMIGLSLSVAGLACTAPTADDASASPPASDPQTSDGADQEIKAAVFGASDDGKTVSVVAGRSFAIALPENGTTGFVWKVTSVDKSLGAPKETSVPGNPNTPGSSGVRKFTWTTKSPLNLVGKHTIKIDQVRPWDANATPVATFSLTVDITDASLAKTCGGQLALGCDPGQHCEYTGAQACGAADLGGTCQPNGQFCPAVYLPVCGCDGKTYGNGCEANRGGTSVAKDGACAGASTK